MLSEYCFWRDNCTLDLPCRELRKITQATEKSRLLSVVAAPGPFSDKPAPRSTQWTA